MVIALMLVCFSMQFANICQKNNSANTFFADKWHPEKIYIIHQDMYLEFMLPHDKDTCGVANLFFQCKNTGKIHLLDTIKGGIRYFNFLLTTGKYDAILLYNNGNYIRYNDVNFEKKANTIVDMRKNDVMLSCSESQRWLSFRTFNGAIVERKIIKSYTGNSGSKIRGYIFEDIYGEALWRAIISSSEKRVSQTSKDGYFEIDVDDDTNLIVEISFVSYVSQKIKISANSGLIFIMEDNQKNVDEVWIGY